MNMRKLLIAGNWKMNTDLEAARGLAAAIGREVRRREPMTGVETAVCPPFVNLSTVGAVLDDTPVKLGAQNMSDQPSGAYTGEVSASMLTSVGCKVVILGHSERRQYFRETDAQVNAKCIAAQRAGLQPIVCVGEQLAERERGEEKDVVAAQIRGSLAGLDSSAVAAPVVAYEPVWAIGTGQTATPEQAQEMHEYIRGLLEEMWDADAASRTQILYGGSMKPNNAADLLGRPDIDGGLIGGASLDATSFLAIIDAGRELAQ
jgi:triosephosphate isomerase